MIYDDLLLNFIKFINIDHCNDESQLTVVFKNYVNVFKNTRRVIIKSIFKGTETPQFMEH